MSDDLAIKVDKVSKTFRLPHEKTTSIKSAFVNFYRRKHSYEKQEVLNNISFEIKKGEFVGIVGRNGSGKSTLLKLLAGIYTPSSGSIQINGKLIPFIELGVGFNPELTGRENVFLNGALLGFNRKEMEAMYEKIVEFAEIERFMDQKLKNYSSGMQVRLAFSIAIRANAGILVLDEVLAVGDERFQDKCLKVFEELKKQHKTIILVTHDMNSVRRFCDKAIVIHDGNLVFQGPPKLAASEYIKLNFPENTRTKRDDSTGDNVTVKAIKTNNKAKESTIFSTGDLVTVSIAWKKSPRAKNVGIAIFTDSGQYVFGTNTMIDNVAVRGSVIEYEVLMNLGNGEYYMQAGIYGDSGNDKVYFEDEALRFRIVNGENWQGITKLNHKWRAVNE